MFHVKFSQRSSGRHGEGHAHHGHHAHDDHHAHHVHGEMGGHGHGPGGPHHGGRRGGGGRLGRLFAHGDLHLLILHLIDEKPRHGYELIKGIADMAGGVYSPSPGSVYPALTMLEEQGHAVAEAEEGGRKSYAATAAGKAYLAENRAAVESILAHLQHARAAQGPAPAPSIVRAMEGLKLALVLRLERGPLDEAQTRAVTEALEQAIGAIERS